MRRFNHNSAINTRLQAILEDKITSDTSTHLHNTLNAKFGPKVSEKATYDATYSNQLGYLKLETLLKYNKHGAEIAKLKPWDGQEDIKETSIRMMTDLIPKSRDIRNPTKRLVVAKEISNEYKMNRVNPLQEEDFRKIYKERFLGPSVLANSANPNVTLNLVNTIASAKINARINLDTGHFDDSDMEKVRGKPLDQQYLNNSTNIAYFINQILNKQEVLPPWIESQQSLARDITQFRVTLDSYLVILARKETVIPPKPQLTQKFTHVNYNYVAEKIRVLNNSIRDYNLQSPSPNFHKLKLNINDEINDTVNRNYHQLQELIAREDQEMISNTNQGFLSLFDAAKSVPQRRVEKLDFWKSFKQMFYEIR